MNAFKQFVGDKLEDMVQDAVKDAVKDAIGLGGKDKDEKKKEKGGGMLSFFGGDKKKKEEEEKGGLFSFGDKKKKDKDKGGFISKIFDHDDDNDRGKEKKTGFAGLFADQEGGGAVSWEGEEAAGGGFECGGQSVGVNDGDLLNDLMDVAEETAKGN